MRNRFFGMRTCHNSLSSPKKSIYRRKLSPQKAVIKGKFKPRNAKIKKNLNKSRQGALLRDDFVGCAEKIEQG